MIKKGRILIQSDFDNTITIGNVSEQIHEKFGPPEWNQIHKEYKQGNMSVEESNISSFKNLGYPKCELDIFVEENVKFRKGFLEFYNYIKNCDVDFKIVSSGVDFYIFFSLKSIGIDKENISVISGNSNFNDRGIDVQYYDFSGNTISSDFKLTHTDFHKNQYSKIIYLGDSLTDLKSSYKADYVFATDKLYEYYVKNNLNCYEFSNYYEVLTTVKDIIN